VLSSARAERSTAYVSGALRQGYLSRGLSAPSCWCGETPEAAFMQALGSGSAVPANRKMQFVGCPIIAAAARLRNASGQKETSRQRILDFRKQG